MTKKQIDKIDYLEALRLLQTARVKNLNTIVQEGSAAVKREARKILRNSKRVKND